MVDGYNLNNSRRKYPDVVTRGLKCNNVVSGVAVVKHIV